jgi:FkbM family methyltransferase
MPGIEETLTCLRNAKALKKWKGWGYLRHAYEIALRWSTLNRGLKRQIFPGIYVRVSYESRHSIPVGFDAIRRWSIPSMDYVKKHMASDPEACFLDVGAHHGLYSLAANCWTSGEGIIFAFEPHPDTVAILKENLERNGCDRVTVVEKAVGAVCATMSLYGEAASTTTLLASASAHYGHRSSTQVEVTTLDEFCSKNKLTPTIIKIDVEGFEFEVLKGAATILSAVRDRIKIICEMHTFLWQNPEFDLEVMNYLKTYGLTVFNLDGTKAERIRDHEDYVIAATFN